MNLFKLFRENKKSEEKQKKKKLKDSLGKNLEKLKEIFDFPVNEDFYVREVFIKALNMSGVVIGLGGVVNEEHLQKDIIYPLMNKSFEVDTTDTAEAIIKQILTIKTTETVYTYDDVVTNITNGNTILLLEGLSLAIVCDTATLEHRNVEKPMNENVIKGPKEAFVESSKVNRALIRKQIRSEKLVTESVALGNMSEKKLYIMYVKDVVNPDLIKKVKARISQINVDNVQNISMLEQYIEDRPYSLIPTVLETERPDRASSFLMEGHVILIMDSSPSCLIVPVNFWMFFHTAEDHYQRWIYGNFLRFVRLVALFLSLLGPAIYIAVSNYHIEMIPIDLLLSIAATRERLPFPASMEIILMELAFELIREGGIRVPTPIGPTIGIVGALILGQAAVEANIVSPILVIVVAITGLASFAVPEVSLSLMIRIFRFIFLIFGAIFGFYGIAIVMVFSISYISSVKSFDVPFLSPFAPHYKSSNDSVFRPTIWKEWLRPFYNEPADRTRKSKPEGGNKN